MPVTIALSDYSKNYYNNSITQKGLIVLKGLKNLSIIFENCLTKTKNDCIIKIGNGETTNVVRQN